MVFHGGQAAQDIGQIFLGVDTATAATLNDRVDHRTAPTGVGMADKEPALATDHRRSHVVFHEIMPRPGLCRAAEFFSLVERFKHN